MVQIPGGLDAIEPQPGDAPKRTITKPKEHTMYQVVDIETEENEEEQLVYAWRVEQLVKLGLSNFIASAIATFVDWHEIARLVERGCPPELALEIVR